jgi:anaerobic selenocysteine-containing dehydrogenase
MLERGSGLHWDDLLDGVARVLPTPAPGAFYTDQVHTADGRVDCCPPVFTEAIERCHRLFDETSAALATRGADDLLLIHKRDAWMHNSWFSNIPRMKRHGHTNNPLGVAPADAARLSLVDGDAVLVTSAHGEVEAVVEVDADLMDGVVSMVHGWGHRVSPQLQVAAAHPGTNPNALLPTGAGSFEPLSSQAHMTGIPVRLTPSRST